MMLRRLFALGAAPLSHVAWCAPGDFIPAPPFTPRPGFLFRDGPDGKGYYRVGNSPEAPFPPDPSLAPRKQKVREGVDSDGRLRFQEEHHKIFGSGFHHDVFWKCKIVQMWHGCQKFYDDREKRKKMPLIHDFFHNITGFYQQRVSEYETEIIANDGFLLPPDQRGRQVYMLSRERLPGFRSVGRREGSRSDEWLLDGREFVAEISRRIWRRNFVPRTSHCPSEVGLQVPKKGKGVREQQMEARSA